MFEIAKTAAGYASTPTTLVSFNGTNGAIPSGSLIADANGDLFGTTNPRRRERLGTVFEIAKTAAGYASTPTTLVSFNGTNGAYPLGSLIADANGDLFGTTNAAAPTRRHGVRDHRTAASLPRPRRCPRQQPTSCGRTRSGQASIWDMNGNSLVGGGAVSPNPGPSWTSDRNRRFQ